MRLLHPNGLFLRNCLRGVKPTDATATKLAVHPDQLQTTKYFIAKVMLQDFSRSVRDLEQRRRQQKLKQLCTSRKKNKTFVWIPLEYHETVHENDSLFNRETAFARKLTMVESMKSFVSS